MRKLFLLAAFAVSFLCQISAQSDVYEIKSPDGKRKEGWIFDLDEREGARRRAEAMRRRRQRE